MGKRTRFNVVTESHGFPAGFSLYHEFAETIRGARLPVSRRKTLVVELDYPLGATFSFPIRRAANTKCFTRRSLVSAVQKLYRKIYWKGNQDKYGVWGHALEDLHLEGISISPEGVVRVEVGS